MYSSAIICTGTGTWLRYANLIRVHSTWNALKHMANVSPAPFYLLSLPHPLALTIFYFAQCRWFRYRVRFLFALQKGVSAAAMVPALLRIYTVDIEFSNNESIFNSRNIRHKRILKRPIISSYTLKKFRLRTYENRRITSKLDVTDMDS